MLNKGVTGAVTGAVDTIGTTGTTTTSGIRTITLAYYPDSRQEQLLLQLQLGTSVEYMHMMTYDQQGGQHSSFKFR